MTEDIQEINWREVPYNKTLQKLQPTMIHDESGYVVQKSFTRRALGFCNVTYDRDYVKFWLVRNFFKALAITNYAEAQTLFVEAWKEYKPPKEKPGKEPPFLA